MDTHVTRVPHPTPLGQILPVVGALAGLALAYVIPLVSVELIQGSSDAATVFAALLASGGALVLGMPWAAVLGARAGRALAGRLSPSETQVVCTTAGVTVDGLAVTGARVWSGSLVWDAGSLDLRGLDPALQACLAREVSRASRSAAARDGAAPDSLATLTARA